MKNTQDWCKASKRAEELATQLGCCLLGVKIAVNPGQTVYYATLLMDGEPLKVQLAA